ncbi:DinB family protein [Paraglaciecola sp.]|uniref:DinB family protein n=1 Tax=Paraglaciecola sp. TaxID=1920173 RepID=UPI0030F39A13
MSLKSNFELMAQYNQTMNGNIYRAAAQLSAADLAKNQGAFFGSIINTLNHILVADTIWLHRFACHQANFITLDYVRELPVPISLDAVLYADFIVLREHREKMDRVITLFVTELSDTVIATQLSYKNIKGLAFNKNFAHLLQHFFNHQTHHRGQVSTLLYQQGIDIGVTDLLVNIPNIEN